ncbi:DUF4198 domain-containing protein [Gallibacterium sp. AGMB14963]|uniref:DUF4198 domain-containing protein n=1 Tax=Gallibacterium faecale TaxID=3019086 RepID=UPI0022F16B31|nr:DUF4198 domain-containing protein [Gallibacterium sp. AGMB14963]MDA3978785.1 DUF4198 domain-containing protein [Gallibacterium sp. AGMB14963]
MEMKKQIILLLVSLFVSIADAHNVWIEPLNVSKHQYVVKFGHTETEGYPLEKLEEVSYVGEAGAILPIHVEFSKQREAFFTLPKGDIVFLKFNNGVWSKLPNGRYVEKTKIEEPTAVSSINAVKYGKAILNWNQQAFKSHQQPYELIPMDKPEIGKPLSILVLHQGKPVENVKVGSGEDAPFNLTNKQGIVTFLVQKGENRIWAEFNEDDVPNANYDKRSIEYLLTFDVE